MELDWPSRIKALIAGEGPLMVFQPIERLSDRRVVGVEALARFPEDRLPAGSSVMGLTDEAGLGFGPDVWFRAADLVGLGVELELAAISAALDRLDDVPRGAYLSINCGPATLVSGALADALDGRPVERIVVELTEHLAIADYDAVAAAIRDLHERRRISVGAKVPARIPGIAVDDFGAGSASLSHLMKLRKLLSVVKLDISLVAAIDVDEDLQDLAEWIVARGRRPPGFLVIAEGIEHAAQMLTLESLGVWGGQGWHIGRPGPLPLRSSKGTR